VAYGMREQVEMKRVREAVSWAQRELELTDLELGEAIGVSGRSIARWRDARHQPSAKHVMAAEQLLELSHALAAAFGGDHAAMQEWLHQPLPALRRRSPLRAIVAGRVADVLSVLSGADGGVFA
jgi:uncharacterized protein (DUF2384 family)